jgi:hypothetical protein
MIRKIAFAIVSTSLVLSGLFAAPSLVKSPDRGNGVPAVLVK